jgi:hypothetical protein
MKCLHLLDDARAAPNDANPTGDRPGKGGKGLGSRFALPEHASALVFPLLILMGCYTRWLSGKVVCGKRKETF